MSADAEPRLRELTEADLDTLRDIRVIVDRILDAPFAQAPSLAEIESALDEIHELACAEEDDD